MPRVCATLALRLSAFAGTIASGTCGGEDNLHWTLYDNGELVISGSGAMPNSDNIRWNDYRSQILSVTIEEGVTRIWGSAFTDCGNLTSVTFPASLEGIVNWGFAPNPFAGCFALQTITVDEDNQTFCDVDGVLFTKDMGGLYTYPAGKIGAYSIPAGVWSTSDKAFFGCSGLTSVTIPSSLTWFGSGAFAGCTALQTITVDEENSRYCVIDNVLYTVYSDGSMSVHTFPAGISGDGSVLSGVKNINRWSFYGCEGLTSVTIPVSVESVGFEAFFGCDELEVVYYRGSEDQWNQISIDDGNDALISALKVYHATKPDCTLPTGLTTIEDDAFAGCLFTSVMLSDDTVKIGSRAFANCQNLKFIHIPNENTEIDENAFGNLTGLTIYGYRGSTAEIFAAEHGFSFVDMTPAL